MRLEFKFKNQKLPKSRKIKTQIQKIISFISLDISTHKRNQKIK